MLILCTVILLVDLLLLAVVVWNSRAWPSPRPLDGRPPDELDCTVLIPARNEAVHIEACLEAVLAQQPALRQVIVCDDHSHDDTAERVLRLAARDTRLQLIRSPALPPGWCGKPFACATLAAAATTRWMLFLDADARLQPAGAGRMVAEAERRGLTFLSCWPGLTMESAWERLLMPLLNFTVFTLFPAPLSLRRRDPALGLAHGACIMMRRDAYQQSGGHEQVRGETFDDTVLARAWRAGGRHGECLDGQSIVRVRMYDSLESIWHGFAKSFYPAFRHRRSFWLFMGFHTLCFLGPFIAWPWLSGAERWIAMAAAACVVVMRLVQGRRFGFPLWSALLHPLAQLLLLACGLDSWRRCASGRGLVWKGRVYRAKPGATGGRP